MKSVLRTILVITAFLLASCSADSMTSSLVSQAVDSHVASSKSNDKGTYTLVRSTQFGEVRGKENGEIIVWHAIPYGAAPVGELRWQEPQDPEPWSRVKDCTRPGKKAMQYETEETSGKAIGVGTDDCLNLDVYAANDADNLPVLVYIHGGNNQTGSSQELTGEQIVKKDNCVYVSLNYRLGLLGFNALPCLRQEGKSNNYTMLDIAKALDWVRDNIAAFGGNPNNVTVSGFSAGGQDVLAMFISPMFKGKFQKAIVFSGGMISSDLELSAEKTASLLASLVMEDGKAIDPESAKEYLLQDTEETREYLYSLDSKRLAAAIGNANIRMSSFPQLFLDDVVLPMEGFYTEEYNDVPVMLATSADEFSLFNAFDPSFHKIQDEDTRNKAISFSNHYGSQMYRIFNTETSAQVMSYNRHSSIYLAQVDFGSENSVERIPEFGAFQGIFLPMLEEKSAYTDLFGFGNHKGFQDMADAFHAYLASFLATGDPNGEDRVEWVPWTTKNTVTQVFDADDTKARIESKDVSTTYEAILDAMEEDEALDTETKKYIIENIWNGRWFSDALHERYKTPDPWK